MPTPVWNPTGLDQGGGWVYQETPEEKQYWENLNWGGLDPSKWVEGPNHIGTGGKILKTVVPIMLGAMAGYGALGAAGALGAEAGAGAAGSEGALSGLGGVEPISTSGFTAAEGGIGSLGSGWGSSGVVAGEAGATAADAAAVGSAASPGMSAVNAYNYVPFEEGFLGSEASAANPAKPWYSDFLPDWKDLAKQGVKQYVNSQASGGASSGGGSGYPSSDSGGPRIMAGAPNVASQVSVNPMPLGGLVPGGVSNPVDEQAQALAQLLMKKRNGAFYG